MLVAQLKQMGAKGLQIICWEQCPQLSRQCYLFNNGRYFISTTRIEGQIQKEVFIHRPLFAVRIQIAFCQLHGFSYHDTQSHRFDFQICGNLYRISNEVSVMNKCLCRQFGIVSPDILFTLCTRIKDDARTSCCPPYFHRFADGIYKCFGRERLHNARSSDDRNTALYTQTGIKSPSGYLFATRYGNSDGKRIGVFGNAKSLKACLYIVFNHFAGSNVDGRSSHFQP